MVLVARLPAGAGKREGDYLSDCESGESACHQADAKHAPPGTTSKSRKQEYGRDCLDRSSNGESEDPEENVSRHVAQGGWSGGGTRQPEGCSRGQQQGPTARRHQQWSSGLDSASQEPRRLPCLHEEQRQRRERDGEKEQRERTSEDQPADADDEATPSRRCK